MLYLLLSCIFVGIAIPMFEHGYVLVGITLMVLSCFMPVLKDFRDKEPVPPVTVIDPINNEAFNEIMEKLDKIEATNQRCVELLNELLKPLQ
jgi:hypothetical protein